MGTGRSAESRSSESRNSLVPQKPRNLRPTRPEGEPPALRPTAQSTRDSLGSPRGHRVLRSARSATSRSTRDSAGTGEESGKSALQARELPVVTARPESEILGKSASFTKVDLSVRVEALKRPTTTFFMVYSKNPYDDGWKHEGNSDPVENSAYPNFRKWNKELYGGESHETLGVDFTMDSLRMLRFELYKLRDAPEIRDLQQQGFIGCAELTLAEAVFARGHGDGWVYRDLLHPKHTHPGKVAIMVNEDWSSKNTISLGLSAPSVKPRSCWKGRPDPYCVISHLPADAAPPSSIATSQQLSVAHVKSLCMTGEKKPSKVFRTEVCRRTSAPKWKHVELSVQQICQSRGTAPILLEVYDWERMQKDLLLGSSVFTYADMQKAFRDSKNLEIGLFAMSGRKQDRMHREARAAVYQRGSHEGADLLEAGETLVGHTKKTGKVVMQIGISRRYSFYDYLRGGLELQLIAGIDFTRSNLGPHDPGGLHYIDEQLRNDYVDVMRAAGEVFSIYDTRRKYPAYGFGAKLPPSNTILSHCFAISGDFFGPELEGVEAMIEAYQRSAQVVRFHGPSYLREVVQMAGQWALQHADVHQVLDNGVEMRFWCFLLMTDGEIADTAETVAELLKMSRIPIHILAVGLGDHNHTFLQGLDAELGQMLTVQNKEHPDSCIVRSMVTFVRYNEFRGRPRHEFTTALLGQVPLIIRDYYQALEINPWNLDKFEDQNGQPFPVPILTSRPTPKKAGAKAKAAVGSRPGTKDSSQSTESEGTEVKDPLQALSSKKKKLELQLARLPKFLRDWHKDLCTEINKVGYDTKELARAIMDGIASGTQECLLDNVIHSGYGKTPPYQDQMAAVDLTSFLAPEARQKVKEEEQAEKQRSQAMLKKLNEAFSQPKDEKSRRGSMLAARPGSLALASGHADSDTGSNGPALPGAVDSPKRPSGPGTCTICLELIVDVELQPCGHQIACHLCVNKLGVACPLCRQTITGKRRLSSDE